MPPVRLKRDDTLRDLGNDNRQGLVRNPDGSWSLVVWIKMEATSEVRLAFETK